MHLVKAQMLFIFIILQRMFFIMKLSKVALAVSALLISGSALAHGYISNPPSRDYMCKLNNDQSCGGVINEPQSVGESEKGFPKPGTPPDGQLPSGGKYLGQPLDVQTPVRWEKNSMHAGKNNFTWTFTAEHNTTDFKYFITKPDWDQSSPLTRDSFELTPFCVVPMGGQLPNGKPGPNGTEVTHECDVPERSGYQVIYASWEVDNTAMSFYKTIDADFGNEVPSIWENDIGKIQANKDLYAGDYVDARFFGKSLGLNDQTIRLKINTDAEGKKEVWAKALAELINATYPDEIRAGVKNSKGEVNPIAGVNHIFVKKGSKVTSAQVSPHSEHKDPASIELSNIKDSYQLDDGAANVTLDVTATGKLAVNAQVFDKDGNQVGLGSAIITDGTASVTAKVLNASAGMHKLVVLATEEGQSTVIQKEQDIMLKAPVSGDVDFEFPDGLGKYKSGTKVLQPKNNTVYECKPGAVGGWCNIYSASANHYEPGIGSNWQDAWNEVGPVKK